MALSGWDANKKIAITNILPTSASDDFTGEDGSIPNPLLWKTYHDAQDSTGTNGTVKILTNTLQIAIPNSTSLPAARSLFTLSGDFDIQVDFAQYGTTGDPGWAYGLAVGPLAETIFYAHAVSSRYNTTLGPYRGITPAVTATAGTLDTSGKFRITRTGSSVSVYFWNGSTWTQIATDPNYITSDVYVKLWTRKWATTATFDVRYDNFIVNSGTVVWPELTDVQVPIILRTDQHPVSVDDVFTDANGSIPDLALWKKQFDPISVAKTGVATIQSNSLDFAIVSAQSYPFVSSIFQLSGDIDIEVAWSIDSQPPVAWSIGLTLGNQSYSAISEDKNIVTARYGPTNGPYRQSTTNVAAVGGGSPDLSGKFRITRTTAGVANAYYWNGSSWVTLIATDSSFDTGPLFVTLFARTWGTNQTFNANFDNFQINSGTVIWPVTFNVKSLFADIGTNNKKIALEIGDTGTECTVQIPPGGWTSQPVYALLLATIPSLTSSTVLNLYFDSTHADNSNVTDVDPLPAAPTDPYELEIYNLSLIDDFWGIVDLFPEPSTGSITINIGGTTITAIYLGAIEVTDVYIGDVKVG